MPPSSGPLVVFCHLRWDFVFQRPQHLLTRIARERPVLFIEEPVHGDEPGWEISHPTPGLTVCRPRSPVAAGGFTDEQAAVLRPLVKQLLAERAATGYDLWFYTPMALPLADGLTPGMTVYDCMDELSAFKNAPPRLLELEQQLLDRADVVFTGGPSLYRAKKDRHPNAHCFPSSVDAAHFGRTDLAEPVDQANLPHPRLGFYGVIDERFDVPLLATAAASRPDWQFVLVGPVVKIDPADLPHAPNIHYLGQKGYADLPAYLHGWDVALLPFARNSSTKFISPTKTLEYMAAGKPVVSTPITDVAEPYGDVVGLADTAAGFVAACEAALGESAADRGRRLDRYRDILARTSWDRTAAAMLRHLGVRSAERGAEGGEANRDAGSAVPRSALPAPRSEFDAVVIGAGPTGLSAAYHLGESSLLLEADSRIGGWCKSIVDRGFTFDYAGHIMFSNDPYVHELYGKLLGDNVHWQDREAWVFSKNVYTRYPFQGSLYGLPAEVIKECVMGAIEARYGTADKKPEGKPEGKSPVSSTRSNGSGGGTNGHHTTGTNGHGKPAAPGNRLAGNVASCAVNGDAKGDGLADCCGDGIAESTVPLVQAEAAAMAVAKPAGPRNFAEFIDQVWGKGIAKHFAVPYNRKIWAVPLEEMETSWLGGRVPMPDLGEMIEGALSPKGKPMGPNARFGYPLRGGFQALMDGFEPLLAGEVRLSSRVKAVSPGRHTLTLTTGEVIGYDQLVSTMPLPLLVKACGDEAPEAVRQAAQGLRHTSVRCVNIGVGRANVTDKHWIYYPEESVFHRIFVQGNASPHCNPPGGFGLTCEITYGPLKPLPCDGQALIDRCIQDCIKVGIITADDPVWCANQVDMPFAYVVYDHARKANVDAIRDWLLQYDIHLSGRYSEWEYYNSDHAFLAGRNVARAVQAHRPARTAAVAAAPAGV